MAKMFAGARIARLRAELGMSQVEMARRLDLSTSYINQLENEHRPLTVPVLLRLTSTFGVDASYFSGEADARLLTDVRAALSGSGIDASAAGELVARFPEVAKHLIALTGRLHEDASLLSRVVDAPSTPADRAQFAYERVRDYFYARRNHIPELDSAAERLAAELGLGRDATAADRILRGYLAESHGVHVALTSSDDAASSVRRHYDRASRVLTLGRGMTASRRLFQEAVQLALVEHAATLDRLVDGAPELDEASRPLARIGLAQYFAGALVLPYGTFLAAARELRYDIDLLAERFDVGFETTCHRLSTLQRPGNAGIPFLFLRTDRAGNISKRQSATAFHFSRTGGSCPLWVVHRAFETPQRVVRQIAEMPDGRRYLWIARTVKAGSRGFNRPVAEFSVALGCAIEHAESMVYAAGLDLRAPGAATLIGAGCRVCERENCPQRAFPRAGTDAVSSEDVQHATPYAAS